MKSEVAVKVNSSIDEFNGETDNDVNRLELIIRVLTNPNGTTGSQFIHGMEARISIMRKTTDTYFGRDGGGDVFWGDWI